MWIMKSPAGKPTSNATGRAFGQDLKNGYIMCTKQYEMKILKDRKFTDVTPDFMKDVDPKNPTKAVVIRWGGYGDIIMCLPAVALLKEKYKHVNDGKGLYVVFAGMDKHVAVLDKHPLVDAVLLPPAHQIGNLIEEYALAYDLSGIIPCNIEADYKNAYDIHFDWFGFNSDEIEDEKKLTDLVITPKAEVKVLTLLSMQDIVPGQDTIIYFNPSSSTEMRNLPFNIARDTLNRIAKAHPKAKIIVSMMQDKIQFSGRFICKKCKHEQVTSVGGALTKPIKIRCSECGEDIYIVPHDYSGKVERGKQKVVWHKLEENIFFPNLSFENLTALIYLSDLVVSVDSAPIHIAGMLDIPVIGIFSSFDGDLRMRYFNNATWIQHKFRCGPCFQHNIPCMRLRTEKRMFSPCMDDISPEEIASKVKEVLEAKAKVEAKSEVESVLNLDIVKPAQFIPPDKDEVNVTCFACKSKDVSLSYRKGEHTYWLCNKCKSLFVFPKPTPEYLAENYQDPDYNIVFNDLEDIKKVARTVTTIFAGKFDFNGKLLEIGANIGWFGQEAVRLGWDYTGVEISKASVAECRKKGLTRNKIIEGSIEDPVVFQQVQDKNPNGYDMFIIHNTIEHVIDPVSLLQTLSTLASSGSVFSISTPCTDFWDGRNTWGHINPFFAGEHINISSKLGMECIAKRIGFNIINTEDFTNSGEVWYVLEKP